MAKMTTDKIETVDTVNNQVDMQSILKEMQEMRQELQSNKEELENMKAGKNNITDGKKKYEGPWAYSYKMWGGIPVLGYTSYRKDKTKDFIFKNDKGQYMSNHYVELSLANGSTANVEVNEFGQNFTKSEKIICDIIGDPKLPEGFKFSDDTYGEFIVNIGAIN